MDFGDIFFIAVFIIIIISNVYKQMKKARLNTSGGEAPVKKPGWRAALELILEEARKQTENQAKQGTAEAPIGRPTGWENVLTQSLPESSPSKYPSKADTAEPETLKPEKSTIEKAAMLKSKESDQPPLGSLEKIFSVPEWTADGLSKITGMPEPVVPVPKDYYADKTVKKRPQHLSQDALRNAVVWAEILAPPVGLRNME
jgi:hypothetical protein